MMSPYLADFTMNHWAWASLALALAVLELLAPGVFFLWLGIAAAIVAVLVALLPELGWQLHVAAFAILSVAVTWAGRRLVQRHQTPSQDNQLNQRGQRLIGQVLRLSQPIENGSGRVKIGDGSWLVHGSDLPAGTEVKVVGVDGSSLRVEEVED